MKKSKKSSALVEKLKSIPKAIVILFWIVLCVLAFIVCYSFLWAPKHQEHTHEWGEWTVVQEAACTEDGQRVRSCECGEIETESIAATGHNIGEWQVAKEATCTEDGQRVRSCACGETETESIAATGHKPGEWQVVKEASETEKGEKSISCSVCGAVMETEEIAQIVVEATPEKYSEGLEYKLNDDGKSYSVVGIGTCKDLDVVIPKIYNGKAVTSIGNNAFYNCKTLKSITVSNSVTNIGYYAFSQCVSLTSITIPSSVVSIDTNPVARCRNLKKIEVSAENPNYHVSGDCLIETKTGKLVSGCNTSVIPSDGSVTSIGNYAFEACNSLTSITIPSSVVSIGINPVSGCNSIEKIEVSAENPNYHVSGNCLIETKRGTLISGCYTSVIPTDRSVTYISNSAFSKCTKLTSITIPSSVTGIGESAFYMCTKLTSITIQSGVTSIGLRAFSYCTSLASIVIPSSVTSIGNSAFYGCEKLTSITIPSSVTSIGNYAFRNCESLTSITIPSSVTSIGLQVFGHCNSLTSITIPSSVTSIGEYAFGSCDSLTSITYTGTMAQWNAIRKVTNWDKDTLSHTIHCTDGDITK